MGFVGFFILFLGCYNVKRAQLFSLPEENVLEVTQNKLTTRQSLIAWTLSQQVSGIRVLKRITLLFPSPCATFFGTNRCSGF